jgi:NADH-quinone oxidoreductase subunit H
VSEYYLPWPERRRPEFRGAAKLAATAARVLYQASAPIVRRFPGAIFTTAVVFSCLLAWLVALSLRAAWLVQQQAADDGAPWPNRWFSVEELRAAAAIANVGWPAWLLWALQSEFVRDVIGVVGVLAFVSLLAMFAIWWERKVSAFMQSRLGPMRVGGWHGWSQSLADGIKLIAKEDLIPDGADRALFRLAPYLAFVPALAAFMALPFGVYWVFRDLDVALLFILAMMGIEVVGVLIAGWASNNKWSVYGAMREACQMVGYEIPMGMSLLVPVMIAGSLRLNEIAQLQAGGWANWLAFHSPWAFIAMLSYFVASLASCKRAPFDLPEAESELVAGFHTEYSGFRWALFFFAEYAAMFVVSGLLTVLFLGAWDAPWSGLAPAAWLSPDAPLAQQLIAGVFFSGPLWFVAKCLFLIYVQMWLRWTLPRLRIDQVLYSCVQVMLPLIMLVLLASTFWELAVSASPAFGAVASVIQAILAILGAIIAIGILYVAAAGFRARRALVGDLAVERPLRGG